MQTIAIFPNFRCIIKSFPQPMPLRIHAPLFLGGIKHTSNWRVYGGGVTWAQGYSTPPGFILKEGGPYTSEAAIKRQVHSPVFAWCKISS